MKINLPNDPYISCTPRHMGYMKMCCQGYSDKKEDAYSCYEDLKAKINS